MAGGPPGTEGSRPSRLGSSSGARASTACVVFVCVGGGGKGVKLWA